jgi:predicted RecA/RadA family phage recombinase
MSRERGTFNFAANFELLKKGPIDASQLVETYADLTNPATWEDSDSLIWLFDGKTVSVSNDSDPSKNGLYYLKDAVNYTSTSSWEKLGAQSGSTINDVQNIGSGVGVFSGITGTSILLRSIIGSGDTNVSLSGDSIVINSTDSTALQNGILKFDSNQQTYLPYSAYTSGITFYTGTTCPNNIDRLNLNARLTATAFRVSTGCTALTGLTFNPGDLYWDSENMTIALKQTNEVTQQIGQELFIRAKNSGASTIENGTVVYITGSDIGNPTINPARASENDGDKVTKVIGITTEDITAGDTGFVTTVGIVRDLNTTGFTAGDTVYLSTSAFGQLTTTKPVYPDYVIEIGVVTKIDSTNGQILVKVSNLSQIANIRGVEEKNAPFTASTRTDVISAVGSGTYYLPPSPLKGQEITVIDKDGDSETWNIIIDGNGKLINGDTQAILNSNYGSMTFVYDGDNWFATTITP